MKVKLLERGNSPCVFNPDEETLKRDLGLDIVLDAMAGGDETVGEICREKMFMPLTEKEDILYRREVLEDAFRMPEAVREFYKLTKDTEYRRRSSWNQITASMSATAVFHSAVGQLGMYLEMLRKLRKLAEKRKGEFHSEAFTELCALLCRELEEGWLKEAEAALRELDPREGTVISARMGGDLRGIGYILCRRPDDRAFRKVWQKTPAYKIPTRDETGMEDLNRRTDRALRSTSGVLARSAEHLTEFFNSLRRELAFYVGCLNLKDVLETRGLPCTVPGFGDRSWTGLYDLAMALGSRDKIIGNDGQTGAARLTIVTGANQGGKSTFLRSVGQAQLMAQCGMPVAASVFKAPLVTGLFTHFRKEEDGRLQSGKLDEELERMSLLTDRLTPGALVLFNESFAATNEREGSAIAGTVTDALLRHGIEVFSVTHLYTYASGYLGRRDVCFLNAERLEDGGRTCRIVPGLPEETAYGEDLFRRIFGGEQL